MSPTDPPLKFPSVRIWAPVKGLTSLMLEPFET